MGGIGGMGSSCSNGSTRRSGIVATTNLNYFYSCQCSVRNSRKLKDVGAHKDWRVMMYFLTGLPHARLNDRAVQKSMCTQLAVSSRPFSMQSPFTFSLEELVVWT
jgi:hypothetical protein